MNHLYVDLANEANQKIGYVYKFEDAKTVHALMETFAELIVQECAKIVCGVPTCGPGSKGCDEIIKEHFGVK